MMLSLGWQKETRVFNYVLWYFIYNGSYVLAYDVLWKFKFFAKLTYDSAMNDHYAILQDLQEVKYAMLLLGGVPRSWQ